MTNQSKVYTTHQQNITNQNKPHQHNKVNNTSTKHSQSKQSKQHINKT